MRTTIFSIASILALAAIVSMSEAANDQSEVAKTKERIWMATQDRG